METSTKFTDRRQNEWDLKVTLRAAERVDASDYSAVTDKELGSFLEPTKELMLAIFSQRALLYAMAFTICLPQIRKKWSGLGEEERKEIEEELALDGTEVEKLTEDELLQEYFCSGLAGDELDKLRKAFLAAFGDFHPKQQTALSMLVDQLDKAEEKINEGMTGLATDVEDLITAEIGNMITEAKEELQSQRSKLGEKSTG